MVSVRGTMTSANAIANNQHVHIKTICQHLIERILRSLLCSFFSYSFFFCLSGFFFSSTFFALLLLDYSKFCCTFFLLYMVVD